MLVRRLTKEDKFQAGRVSGICFHERVADLEERKKVCEEDESEDWGAFTEDGTIVARMINNRYTTYIDGSEVQNGGIGYVSTMPEYRDTGAIREIFEKLLPYAYANGEVISTLYPFKHAFYRKFGYEVVAYRNQYKFRPEVLSGYRFDGEVVMWQEGDSTEEFTALYGDFAPKYNLAVKRDNEAMAGSHIKKNIYKDRKFSYLFRKDGKTIAYLLMEDTFRPESAFLWVEEAVWSCPEGFRAILGFLGRFEADYGDIELTLPSNLEFHNFVRSPKAYEIHKNTRYDYMVRAVNVEKLLEIMDKPEDCDFTLQVEDAIIPENNRVFRVTAGGVTEVAGPADVQMSIQSFSQLAVGAASFEEVLLRGDITVKAKEEMLARVFVKKPIFINEHF